MDVTAVVAGKEAGVFVFIIPTQGTTFRGIPGKKQIFGFSSSVRRGVLSATAGHGILVTESAERLHSPADSPQSLRDGGR
jgi:hypothetical protein